MLDNIIERLLGWCALFAIIWVVFAYFDVFSKSDTLTVYELRPTGDRTGLNGRVLPEMIGDGVKTYRTDGNKVTVKYGSGAVSSYENCNVFDVENWECTLSDASSTFGARSGKYFEYVNTIKFPHLAEYDDNITVSRFRYIINSCKWTTTGFLGYVECALIPFVT